MRAPRCAESRWMRCGCSAGRILCDLGAREGPKLAPGVATGIEEFTVIVGIVRNHVQGSD